MMETNYVVPPLHRSGQRNYELCGSFLHMSGVYDIKGEKGDWDGKATWNGDQYCYQARSKVAKKYNPIPCNIVYLDGCRIRVILN